MLPYITYNSDCDEHDEHAYRHIVNVQITKAQSHRIHHVLKKTQRTEQGQLVVETTETSQRLMRVGNPVGKEVVH